MEQDQGARVYRSPLAYEAVRTRWSPLRFAFRWWVTAAALIWIFVKLPQEYWIHIAQLDVSIGVGRLHQ